MTTAVATRKEGGFRAGFLVLTLSQVRKHPLRLEQRYEGPR